MKFTPSEEDPHGDFADELYYPPSVEKEMPSLFIDDNFRPDILGVSSVNKAKPRWTNNGSPYRSLSDISIEDDFAEPARILNKKSMFLNRFDDGEEPILGFDNRPSHKIKSNFERSHDTEAKNRQFEQNRISSFPKPFKKRKSIPNDQLEFLTDQLIENLGNYDEPQPLQDTIKNLNYEREFSRKYKYPSELTIPDVTNGVNFWSEKNIRAPETRLFSSNEKSGGIDLNKEDSEEIFESQFVKKPPRDSTFRQSGMYTEGGLVKPVKNRDLKPGIFNSVNSAI